MKINWKQMSRPPKQYNILTMKLKSFKEMLSLLLHTHVLFGRNYLSPVCSVQKNVLVQLREYYKLVHA